MTWQISTRTQADDLQLWDELQIVPCTGTVTSLSYEDGQFVRAEALRGQDFSKRSILTPMQATQLIAGAAAVSEGEAQSLVAASYESRAQGPTRVCVWAPGTWPDITITKPPA